MTNGISYTCWGDDKEDLKQQIIDQLHFDPDDYSAVKAKARKIKKAWRVSVKCSQGHENVFGGEVWVTPEEYKKFDGDYICEEKPQMERK